MMNFSTEYYNNTFDSKNPLRRYAQRSRIKKSINLIQPNNRSKILDYGCGDALLLNILHQQNSELFLIGYEPYMDLLPSNQIKIIRDLEVLLKFSDFDCITSFEVFEHLGNNAQITALKNIKNLLSENGVFIMSVPIELGFPALVKNLMRWRFYWKSDKKWFINIFKSIFSIPIPEYNRVNDYIPLHMGFNYKDLENIIKNEFNIVRKINSPFSKVGHNFNSQVFYICKPK